MSRFVLERLKVVRNLVGYEELLTSLWDHFEQEYPTLHELREAAKLAAAAKWIPQQKPSAALPREGRVRWQGPAEVPGLVFYELTPDPVLGAVKTHNIVIAEGGVSLTPFPQNNVNNPNVNEQANAHPFESDPMVVDLSGLTASPADTLSAALFSRDPQDGLANRIFHKAILLPEPPPIVWITDVPAGTGSREAATADLNTYYRRLFQSAGMDIMDTQTYLSTHASIAKAGALAELPASAGTLENVADSIANGSASPDAIQSSLATLKDFSTALQSTAEKLGSAGAARSFDTASGAKDIQAALADQPLVSQLQSIAAYPAQNLAAPNDESAATLIKTLTPFTQQTIQQLADLGADLHPVAAMAAVPSIDINARPVSDSSVVDLRDISLKQADQALMKHQWDMSIDSRYLNDPPVQNYLKSLWAVAANPEDPRAKEANAKLEGILADQLKANGWTADRIETLFNDVATVYTGEGDAPKEWSKTSPLAKALDADLPHQEDLADNYYGQMISSPGNTESIKADASYMAPGQQHREDCVLYAIANGAQVPLARITDLLDPTVKALGMDPIEIRKNPDLTITGKPQGGRGGLTYLEEMLISEQVGTVVAVPAKHFAKAIENTGRPVITAVQFTKKDEHGEKVEVQHEVVVTGIHRAADGKIYYSVMDSNLVNYPNFTAYEEKNEFESHLLGGGFVILPAQKP